MNPVNCRYIYHKPSLCSSLHKVTQPTMWHLFGHSEVYLPHFQRSSAHFHWHKLSSSKFTSIDSCCAVLVDESQILNPKATPYVGLAPLHVSFPPWVPLIRGKTVQRWQQWDLAWIQATWARWKGRLMKSLRAKAISVDLFAEARGIGPPFYCVFIGSADPTPNRIIFQVDLCQPWAELSASSVRP